MVKANRYNLLIALFFGLLVNVCFSATPTAQASAKEQAFMASVNKLIADKQYLWASEALQCALTWYITDPEQAKNVPDGFTYREVSPEVAAQGLWGTHRPTPSNELIDYIQSMALFLIDKKIDKEKEKYLLKKMDPNIENSALYKDELLSSEVCKKMLVQGIENITVLILQYKHNAAQDLAFAHHMLIKILESGTSYSGTCLPSTIFTYADNNNVIDQALLHGFSMLSEVDQKLTLMTNSSHSEGSTYITFSQNFSGFLTRVRQLIVFYQAQLDLPKAASFGEQVIREYINTDIARIRLYAKNNTAAIKNLVQLKIKFLQAANSGVDLDEEDLQDNERDIVEQQNLLINPELDTEQCIEDYCSNTLPLVHGVIALFQNLDQHTKAQELAQLFYTTLIANNCTKFAEEFKQKMQKSPAAIHEWARPKSPLLYSILQSMSCGRVPLHKYSNTNTHLFDLKTPIVL